MTEIFATSVFTLCLVSVVIWLSRTWITARLTADIRLDNDSRLEELKSQLKNANDALGSVVGAGDRAYSQSQLALLPYKIKAIEAIWGSVVAWSEMATASMFVSILPIEWVKKYGSDPSTKRNFETVLGSPGHLIFLKARRDTETFRPFISERAWALYSAYSGFYQSRVMKAAMLTLPSVNHVEVWERANERDLVKASAPAKILELYDADVVRGSSAFLTYLQDELIEEFRVELSGARDSRRAATNTAAMLEAAETLVLRSTRQFEVQADKPLDAV